MSGLETIREHIKTTIEAAISTLHGYDIVPDSANVLPCFVIVPFTADFDKAMARGTDTWDIDLLVLTSTSTMVTGQNSLDSFISGAGTNSIRQAIFQAPSLGLSDTNAHVSQMLEYGMRFSIAGFDHIGARLRLMVITKGTDGT